MYANRALSHTHWWPSHNIIATANVSLAQILLARNDIEASLNAIQIAEEERKNRLMTPFVHCLVDVTWVQIWLKQGKWNLLNQWEHDQISAFESKIDKGDGIDEYLELRMIMLVRLWIEKTRLDAKIERYEKGLQLLDRLEKNSRSSGRMNSLTFILLYKSIIHFFTDKKEDAFKDLDDCFTLAEPGGYMRIFLDAGESAQILIFDYLNRSNAIHKLYAMGILKSFGGLSSIQKYNNGAQELLTSRENDILQLLVKGCSNREIAEKLVLSEGTIKFHIHNILGKLNVNSRTQAIVKARELDLI
jgi:LuxR family maltose regulon positive regulatory protein